MYFSNKNKNKKPKPQLFFLFFKNQIPALHGSPPLTNMHPKKKPSTQTP
jgi:hypothetical protein